MAENLFQHADNFESFSQGATIFKEGEAGCVMYGLKEGRVEIMVGNAVVETLEPGEILGEMALVDQEPRCATAIAKTDCQLVPINERMFLTLIQRSPRFALRVIRTMVRRLRHMNDSMKRGP